MRKSKVLIGGKILFLLLCILFPTGAFAQRIDVRGVITDNSGEPIIGAAVQEKGTFNGIATDVNGAYTLNVPSNATLVVSCIGYESQEIEVAGRRQIDLVLRDDADLLDEVLVVGYGTIRKRDLTGAVSAIGNKDFKDTPVANIGQALQGKVAGLHIIDSGSPGSDVSIKVRGLGSINNCDPLIVIDGIPTSLGLHNVNTADIERVDVLKDASATAIYGSRGANGVLMITTKAGRKGEPKLSFSASVDAQTPTRLPEMLNAAQYAALSNEMMVNSGRNPNPDWINPESLGVGTDWVGAMFRTGINQKYTLSYSGGTEKSNYYFSGGFLDQIGTIKNTHYRRYTFKANSETQVLPWLKLSNNILFRAGKPSNGAYSVGNILGSLPVIPIYDANGEYAGPEGNAEWYGSIRNVVGENELSKSWTNSYGILANFTAELTLAEWLKFRSSFGYDAGFSFSESFTPKYNYKPIPVERSEEYKSASKSSTYLWDNYFLVEKTFRQKHHLNLMAGTSAQWNTGDDLSAKMADFLFSTVHQLDNGITMEDIGGSRSEWSLLSLMARLNYSYADRYMFTATIRRDGSSRFGSKNKWGTFPSVSVAWRPSNESWYPKNAKVNDLKIRAGYGVTGSQASVSNYGYLATYNTGVYPFGNDTAQAALYSTTLAAPGLHWEEVAQSNIGLDFGLFNSRLSFSIDAYIKDTRDMLVKAAIPITAGFNDTSSTYTNAGKVRNKGVEMSLHSLNFNGEFGWETDLSLTYNVNRIVDLNSDVPLFLNQLNNSYVTRLANGFPINTFYGYVMDGLFQTQEDVDKHAVQPGAAPGDIRFRDLNNDGVVNDEDRAVLGNPNPTWQFSLNNRFTWKGWELAIYLQGVAGNKIFDNSLVSRIGMSSASNQATWVLDRWTGPGTSDWMPRAVYGDPNQNCRVSSRFVEDGSYLRVKNVSLGYSLPSSLLRKVNVDGVRLMFSCENLLTLTKYFGFDPEVGLNGIGNSRYPIPRTYSLALNINF